MQPSAPVTPEEKQNGLLTSGLTSLLKPTSVGAVNIALSNRQNFSLAAEQIFVHALNRAVWNYRHDYAALDLLMSAIRNVAIEGIATPDGLNALVAMVFEDAAMREFVFTVQTQFWSQFSEFHQAWNDMLGDIAESLTGAIRGIDVDASKCLVPEEIRLRVFPVDQMKALLVANNWLVTVIFIILWGRTYTYDELRATFRRGQQA